MTTITRHSLAIGTLAVLTFTGSAASQTTPPTLNALEVQNLVASAEPADNAKLSAHFAALAERYTAQAKRHTAMAQASVGNPSRNLATGMTAHCKRLSELNTQSAATLRELADHHAALAKGAVSAAPAGGSRFQGGTGAAKPTDAELKALSAKAATPAEHRSLEEYFVTLAKRYTSDANDHTAIAQSYRGTRIAQAAAHCDRIVTNARESAKEATAAAEMHAQLANVAR
jgi:hypothetical protein